MISKLSWTIIILGTLVMVVVMTITGKPLKTSFTPNGIIDLELASKDYEVYAIVGKWNFPLVGQPRHYIVQEDGTYIITGSLLTDAKRNTYLDFIFIIFYTSLFVACCKTLSRKLKLHRFWSLSGQIIAKAAVVSALLDVVENTGMLISLSGNITQNISMMTATASLIKWLIVFCTILYISIAFIYWKIMYRNKVAD